jgi:hypothetical protein
MRGRGIFVSNVTYRIASHLRWWSPFVYLTLISEQLTDNDKLEAARHMLHLLKSAGYKPIMAPPKIVDSSWSVCVSLSKVGAESPRPSLRVRPLLQSRG